MQFSQLEYLQAVANYGGVRKAARAVHVSPQAVSSAIKKLESEYQIVLLNRSAGEAVLSPAGREFARRARVILAQVDDLNKYTQSGNGGPTATFVFTSPVFTGGGVFFPKTGTTRLKARTLRFTLMCGISQRLHALNHLCLAFRMRPSHLRNQGTVSFLRNTWVKRSSRFFRAQRVINLWVL
mgnify:CR=1 FL=1